MIDNDSVDACRLSPGKSRAQRRFLHLPNSGHWAFGQLRLFKLIRVRTRPSDLLMAVSWLKVYQDFELELI